MALTDRELAGIWVWIGLDSAAAIFHTNRYHSLGLFLVNGIQTLPSPFKSGRIRYLVQKDAECSEIYENTILRFFNFWEMVDFVLKILRIFNKISLWMTKNGEYFLPQEMRTIFAIISFYEKWSILYSNS